MRRRNFANLLVASLTALVGLGLLGERVVVATRGGARGRTWAILSEVAPETERRLFDRLQAAPRAIDAGHQILSIEKGAYELTSHAGTTRTSLRTIVLGPAGRS